MDIITKNTTNYIYANISNEVVNEYYTMTIEAAEYTVNVTLAAPEGVNDRYVAFELIEGSQDLANATIELPNNGDSVGYEGHIHTWKAAGASLLLSPLPGAERGPAAPPLTWRGRTLVFLSAPILPSGGVHGASYLVDAL